MITKGAGSNRAGLSRREFFQFSGGIVVGLTLPSIPANGDSTCAAGQGSWTLKVIRPEDLLILQFRFINLVPRQYAGRTLLIETNNGAPAFVIVGFPSQSIEEEAFRARGTIIETPLKDRVAAFPSGADKSILKFEIQQRLLPNGGPPARWVGYNLEELIAWDQSPFLFNPIENGRAIKKAPVPYTKDSPTPDTAIEAPRHLYISPMEGSGWRTNVRPKRNPTTQLTELWQARLCKKDDDDQLVELGPVLRENPAEILRAEHPGRAFWTDDYGTTPPPNPEPKALTTQDRTRIVDNSMDRQSFAIERLMLTSLGAWLTARGEWDAYGAGRLNALASWRHRSTMGRDQYCQVVYAGYLYPFGHKAVFVTLTERELHPPSGGRDTVNAYLIQRQYILVTEPQVSTINRDIPFTNIEVLTLHSPDLIQNGGTPVAGYAAPPGSQGHFMFWPEDNPGLPFRFQFEGTDYANQRTRFSMPVLFISADKQAANDFTAAEQAWSARDLPKDKPETVVVEISGSPIAYTPIDDLRKSVPNADSTLATYAIRFSGKWNVDGNGAVPTAFLARARVCLPAVKQILGQQDAFDIAYLTDYTTGGFDAPTLVKDAALFAKVVSPPTLTFNNFPLATPALQLGHLSATRGLFGGRSDRINIADFLGVDAQLFGGISLSDVLGPLSLADLPSITAPGLQGQSGRVAFAWCTSQLKDGGLFRKRAGCHLCVKADIDRTRYAAECTVDNFAIDFGVVRIEFNSLSVKRVSGSRPIITHNIKDVIFSGALSFVQSLAERIKAKTSNVPTVRIVGTNLHVERQLPPFDIQMGALALRNVALAMHLQFPFGSELAGQKADALAMGFSFGTRERPFLINVGVLGGGAFFGMTATAKGLQSIEAAFEFGGVLGIDLGVANGCATIVAGIYFRYGGTLSVSGYVRCSGVLNILGMISLSLEFYLGLGYDKGAMCGRAQLTVSIDILFFSASVTLTFEQTFAGSVPSADASATTAEVDEHLQLLAQYA